jgi:hypothetical protein
MQMFTRKWTSLKLAGRFHVTLVFNLVEITTWKIVHGTAERQTKWCGNALHTWKYYKTKTGEIVHKIN